MQSTEEQRPEETPTAKLDSLLGDMRIEELSDSQDDDVAGVNAEQPTQATPAVSAVSVPPFFTSPPPIVDALKTQTSELQEQTVEECLPFLSGTNGTQWSPSDLSAHGIPRLQRETHIKYLRASLGTYPSNFAAIDASRPWIMYWALTGLSIMGADISEYAERYSSSVDTFHINLFVSTNDHYTQESSYQHFFCSDLPGVSD